MLTTLKQIVQEVSRTPGLEAALNRLVTLVKAAMQVDSCSIYLANYEQQHFVLTATNGLDPAAVGQVCIGFSEGLIGLVGQREEPLNIENAHQHPRFKHYPEVKEESYHAFLGTPIIYQRKVLGVMTMQQQAQRQFSQDEEAFLVTLATQIALEIANADMLDELIKSEGMALPSGQQSINGVPGSSGLAMGQGFVWDKQILLSTLVNRQHQDEAHEISLYRCAVSKTREEVALLSHGLDDSLPDDIKAIFTMYDQLLDANSLGREVEHHIKLGWNAATSLKIVIEEYAARFKAMQDPYMQERAVDIIDLSNRILGYILNPLQQTNTFPEESFILVADEITASMLAECPSERLQGVLSIHGSQNSHAAILARALGIPAIMGVTSVLPSLLDGKMLLIDGYAGVITISPEQLQAQEFARLINEEHALSAKIDALGNEPSITLDNHAMSLYVNAGLSVKHELADNDNIKGVGLYRTEIPFMQRDHFPPEQEQYELYRSILQSHPTKAITMRTLDVGGDKPLAYFPIVEDNPFLGWRGIRLTLDQPEIFLVQARAMIRASEEYTNLQIMLPMITSLSEVKEAKRLLKQAFYEVKEESNDAYSNLMMPKIGIMIEVPAAVYQLPQLAQHVDFFSVGSNDLTQYLLAVDRNNSRVSSLYNSFHPAVLTVLQQIAQQALMLHKPITVCGELAGDPAGVVLLMAMGYQKLSMNAHSVRKINWVIRSIELHHAQQLWSEVSALDDPNAIKMRVDLFLETHGLGGLVRAGG
mgnify:CR=1 FL=1